MRDSQASFDQVNLVVGDMDAALDFYRRLGVTIHGAPEWPPGSGARHAEADSVGEARFELDNHTMAAIWHVGWRQAAGGSRVVLGFSFASREAVDERYADLVGAGYVGRQPPYDAFWGALCDRPRSRRQRRGAHEPGRPDEAFRPAGQVMPRSRSR
jgi:uncharacterized glyoxalase superfamily protein PhnB